MDWFLKGYYWYKNLWDEVLFFWVVNKIFKEFDVDKLYVEVSDKNRFSQWIDKNRQILEIESTQIILVEKWYIPHKNQMLFVWGGEFFADQRKFPYDWWNILFKFFKHIIKKKFVLLWWISRPKKFRTKILYRFVLPKADKIILREKHSFDIAMKYNTNSYLYRDFAQDIYEKIKINKKNNWKKVLLNTNPYIYNLKSLEEILHSVKSYKKFEKYFVPFDINEDSKYYSHIKNFLPDLEIYDWTQFSIKEIFEFLSEAKFWIGARLHFLLFLKWSNVDIKPLFYQEKIEKFFR